MLLIGPLVCRFLCHLRTTLTSFFDSSVCSAINFNWAVVVLAKWAISIHWFKASLGSCKSFCCTLMFEIQHKILPQMRTSCSSKIGCSSHGMKSSSICITRFIWCLVAIVVSTKQLEFHKSSMFSMLCLSSSVSKAGHCGYGLVQAIKAATWKRLGCEAKLVTIFCAVQTFRHFDQLWERFICNLHLGGNGAFEIKADGCASAVWAVLWALWSRWGITTNWMHTTPNTM